MSDHSLQTTHSSAPRRRPIAELVTGKLCPGAIWRKRQYRLKFLLRTILYYRATRRMLENLAQRSDFDRLLTTQVTLPSKPHRQYLTRELTPAQRADAVIAHYQFIDHLASRRLAAALTGTQLTPLIALQGKDDARFTLFASCAGKAEREGESTLWLHDGDDRLLASVTFCITRVGGQWQLVIGGLQGPRRSVGPEVIKQATRACYGLFPKRLLLEFLWLLVARCGISALYGVSDRGHVFRALRYRLSKARHFHASYDEFWQSLDGRPESVWRWRLPPQPERKTLEEIASKKRAEYRRRFQLLDTFAEQFRQL